ncbi:MAG TPA: hypothetical protein VL961_04400 [Acidimicrobiales bacterium]|nr:hypothetical protein [Acidimicrobiales bacterium]
MSGHRRVVPMILIPALVAGLLTVPAGASSASSARKDLLRLSDMPKGWSSSTSGENNNSGNFPGGSQLASCIGVPVSVINNNAPGAQSPEFSSKNELQTVGDSVSVYKKASGARTDYDSLVNAKTPNCMSQVLNGSAKSAFDASFGKGSTVGTVEASRLPASAFPRGTANVVLYFPVTSQGTTLNVELVITDHVDGKLEQSVQFISIGSPFPATLLKKLTATANGRI